jgi:hypothetical protein
MPECSEEVNFVAEAMDDDTKKVMANFPCPSCGVPALIRCSIGKEKYDKAPDEFDLEVIRKIAKLEIPRSVPTYRIPPLHMTHERARMDFSGITHIHHFFLPRAAYALGLMWELAKSHTDDRTRRALVYVVEQAIWTTSVLNRFQAKGFKQVNKYLPGVYYVPSHTCEVSPWYALEPVREAAEGG